MRQFNDHRNWTYLCGCHESTIPDIMPLNTEYVSDSELCMYHVIEIGQLNCFAKCHVESILTTAKWVFTVNITNTCAWKAYVVASETVIRVAPCIVLVCLNMAMIVSFRASVKRRRGLKPVVIVRSTQSGAGGGDCSHHTNPGMYL